jgi:hypothetical protein
MTFAKDIEDVANGEIIEAVVIGDMGWVDYNDPETVPIDKRGKVLSWEDARPLLAFDYDDGYGAPECHAIYAWTFTRVIFVSMYDGSTAINAIPRFPVDCMPTMPGGG